MTCYRKKMYNNIVKKLDKNVVILGLVSMFNDISSEMIYPLLPVFLSSVLGVGTAFIGLIEGIADSTASILKIFSGWYSDRIKKRKPIVFAGYSLAAVSRFFLYLSTAGWHVLLVRFADRTGKGIRTAPRDALVADSSSAEERGKAFGVHRALDSMGAFIGPLLAFLILPLINNNYRKLFLWALIPAFLSVLMVIFFVREKLYVPAGVSQPDKKFSIKNLGKEFNIFVIIVSIFTLGNSSDAFLVLRAKDLGVSVIMIPILWLVYNLVGSMSAVPCGIFSDKFGRKKTVILGFLVYSIVYFGFAFSNKQFLIWFFMALYGVYYGLIEGVLRAYVADIVKDKTILATAYGIYNMSLGIFVLPASIIMGVLWQLSGPAVAFGFGGILSILAAIGFIIFIKK